MDGTHELPSTAQRLYYTRPPLRRIAERWTDDTAPEYPVQMMTLECGHSDFYRGQKSRVRCCRCRLEAEKG